MLEYQGRPVAHRGRAGESCCIFFLALFRGDLEHLRMRAQLVRVACKALAGGKNRGTSPQPVFASTRPQAKSIVRKHLSGPAHTARDPQQALSCPRTPAVNLFL